MSEEDLPTRHEVLCEHVHAVVKTLAPDEHVSKVTGMLVECPDEELLFMLANEDVLQQRIRQALQALTGEEPGNSSQGTPLKRSSGKSEKDILGEALFEKVAHIESQLCAQITGMLLELPRSQLDQLVRDDGALKEAVQKARLQYLYTHHPETLPSKDELGEQVFDYVEQIYPEYSPQVTGMLMEMDVMEITELLKDPNKLTQCANEAYEILMEHSKSPVTS